jgi:hypothetical protein
MTDPTALGLRGALFETLDGLRAGEIKPAKAKAICDVAGRILETVRAEMTELDLITKQLQVEDAIQAHSQRLLSSGE